MSSRSCASGGSSLDVSRYGAKEVLLRLLGYVRPHMVSLVLAFVMSAASVVLQLYVPILIHCAAARWLRHGAR